MTESATATFLHDSSHVDRTPEDGPPIAQRALAEPTEVSPVQPALLAPCDGSGTADFLWLQSSNGGEERSRDVKPMRIRPMESEGPTC